jgi:hypothetical protein
MYRNLPDITARVQLIAHTEAIAKPTSRWVTSPMPVEPMEACDLCDGRILSQGTTHRFKEWGDPHTFVTLHEPCFDFFVFLRNQPA